MRFLEVPARGLIGEDLGIVSILTAQEGNPRGAAERQAHEGVREGRLLLRQE